MGGPKQILCEYFFHRIEPAALFGNKGFGGRRGQSFTWYIYTIYTDILIYKNYTLQYWSTIYTISKHDQQTFLWKQSQYVQCNACKGSYNGSQGNMFMEAPPRHTQCVQGSQWVRQWCRAGPRRGQKGGFGQLLCFSSTVPVVHHAVVAAATVSAPPQSLLPRFSACYLFGTELLFW